MNHRRFNLIVTGELPYKFWILAWIIWNIKVHTVEVFFFKLSLLEADVLC